MAHTKEHDWNLILTKRKDAAGVTVYVWQIEGRAHSGDPKYSRDMRPTLTYTPTRTEADLIAAVEAALATE